MSDKDHGTEYGIFPGSSHPDKIGVHRVKLRYDRSRGSYFLFEKTVEDYAGHLHSKETAIAIVAADFSRELRLGAGDSLRVEALSYRWEPVGR